MPSTFRSAWARRRLHELLGAALFATAALAAGEAVLAAAQPGTASPTAVVAAPTAAPKQAASGPQPAAAASPAPHGASTPPLGASRPRRPLAPPPPAKLVDINGASRAELMTLPGVGAAEADRIIANRPYLTKAELVTKQVLGTGPYVALRHHVVALQKKPPKAAKKPAKAASRP